MGENIASYAPTIEIDKNTPLFVKNTVTVHLLVAKMTEPTILFLSSVVIAALLINIIVDFSVFDPA